MVIHHKAFITLSKCIKHIPVDVPNDRAHVMFLIDSIRTIDPTVLAVIAAVQQDNADNRVNFENAFAYLVPACLVAAKAAKKGSVTFDMSVCHVRQD
jgi:hypothetical protein